MTFESLEDIVFNEMKDKIENKPGLSIFAKERAKFEDWTKVELCESLSKHFKEVIPEGDRIDIIAAVCLSLCAEISSALSPAAITCFFTTFWIDRVVIR